MGESAREWIEARYGPATIRQKRIFVASVPVYKGTSVGIGMTDIEALESLRSDLMDDGGPPSKKNDDQ